jgi:hypothetical protein
LTEIRSSCEDACVFRFPLTFWIMVGGMALADEDAVAKYRDFLPTELLALPEEERSSTVPMMFTCAANLAVSPAGELVMQASLNSLMYGSVADLYAAKRAFQAGQGEEATGALTNWPD